MRCAQNNKTGFAFSNEVRCIPGPRPLEFALRNPIFMCHLVSGIINYNRITPSNGQVASAANGLDRVSAAFVLPKRSFRSNIDKLAHKSRLVIWQEMFMLHIQVARCFGHTKPISRPNLFFFFFVSSCVDFVINRQRSFRSIDGNHRNRDNFPSETKKKASDGRR